tara:strand:- start:3984 stop:5204 length:1221 start_codon:yes stop_codon:yes gene_type:complete
MNKILAGLDVYGNIDLNTYQLKEVVIDNLISDPTGLEGRIYYNTLTYRLRLYTNGAWQNIGTATNIDTTYDLAGIGSVNGTAGVSLTGSDATTDSVLIVGSGSIDVTRSGNTLTLTGSAVGSGTVTSVATAGNVSGLTLTGGVITTTGTITLGGTLTLTSGQIIAGLAFTPYNETNPDGYTTNIGTVTSVSTINSTFISGTGGPITTSGSLTYDLSATGTADATTFLRGDNTWVNIVGGVSSVNGQVGIVVLDTDDITEGSTNLYYSNTLVSANSNVVLNTAKVGVQPDIIGVTELKAPFKTIIDIGNVSGAVVIDWSLAIKYKMNLTANITLSFTNITAYEEIKIQGLQITSNNSGYTVTFPTGVNILDIVNTPLDFNLSTTKNFMSIRNLDSALPLFQIANYVV